MHTWMRATIAATLYLVVVGCYGMSHTQSREQEVSIRIEMLYGDVTRVLALVGAKETRLQRAYKTTKTDKDFILPNHDTVCVEASLETGVVDHIWWCHRDVSKGKRLGKWEIVTGLTFQKSEQGYYVPGQLEGK